MSDSEQPKCPVDHSTRSSWLSKLTGDKKNNPKQHHLQFRRTILPVDHNARSVWANSVSVQVTAPEAIETTGTCDSSKIPNTLEDTTTTNIDLPGERELSSIPRTSSNTN